MPSNNFRTEPTSGAVGVPTERLYLDKKSGANTDRPELKAALHCAREGDLILVHTLHRLGRTVRTPST